MWLFSCFKHDPSKDQIKNAMEISRHEEEDRIVRQRREKDEEIEMEKVKEESLKLAKEEEEKRRKEESLKVAEEEEEEEKRRIKESKKKGKRKQVENRNPNCYVCDKKIPSTEKGREYKEHEFWKEKYCPCHDHDDTAKCCSCERLESCRTKYILLEDGRWLCRECMECAVMDTDEVQPLHIELREFYESLNMKIEKEFHLFLVEREALNKAEKEEKIVNQYRTVTRGICLSEEQTVPSVIKGPRNGENKQFITDLVTESHRVPKCEVTAILILYGFPRCLAGYILAHEMMHAWLRLNGYKNLNIVLEEGLCQVLGHMWLETQTYITSDATAASSSRIPVAATTSKKGDETDFEKKLVKFCKYQIETDDSPVYGLGFKKVNQMMVSNHYNLKDTLNDIVKASKIISGSKF